MRRAQRLVILGLVTASLTAYAQRPPVCNGIRQFVAVDAAGDDPVLDMVHTDRVPAGGQACRGRANAATGAGSLGGALLSSWAISIVVVRYGSSIARGETLEPDLATAVIIAAATVAGAAVIAIAGRHRSPTLLGDLNRRSTSGTSRGRRHLVAVQVGLLAGGLVYGALLLGWMISSLARVDLGVPLDHALAFSVGVPREHYQTPARVGGFFSQLEWDVRTIPGVIAVGATSRTPFAGGTNGDVSNAADPSRTVPIAGWRSVTPGFFEAIGLNLINGASFSGRPVTDSVSAVTVERRTREIGVRMALGDTPTGILALILTDGAKLTLVGAALGALTSWNV